MDGKQSPTDCDAASRLARRPLSFLEAQPCMISDNSRRFDIVRERLLAFGDESGCANFRINSLHLQNTPGTKQYTAKGCYVQ